MFLANGGVIDWNTSAYTFGYQSNGAFNSLVAVANDDSSTGAFLVLRHQTSSPATSDTFGGLRFQAPSSTGTLRNLFALQGTYNTTTNAAEVSTVDLSVFVAGISTPIITLDGVNGALSVPVGQIKFPATQNASANANTLDDYEEGSWTPVVQFGGASTGITYTTQAGSYTTVGNIVVAEFIVTLSSKGSSTGNASITGLPYAPAAIASSNAGAVALGNLSGFTGLTGAVFASALTTGLFFRQGSSTGNANLADTAFTNTTSIAGVAVYLKAT